MDKIYYRALYIIFTLVLTVCMILRLWLKLFYTDHQTGFYTGGGLPVVLFTAVFAIGMLALPTMNLLRRGAGDYQIVRGSVLLPVLAVLSGLSICMYTWCGLPNPLGQPAVDPNSIWDSAVRNSIYVLGGLAGLSLVLTGLYALFLHKAPPAILSLAPSVWQVALLLSRFNGYYSILAIADHLLALMFMLFATVFYLGHARTVCGLGRKDGRNYIIFSGLCTAICGLLLAIPNYAYMIANSAPMPVALFSVPESVYTLVMSIYALAFVLKYTRSISNV